MTVADPIHWRTRRGDAPHEPQDNPLAAGAAHVLAVAADQAWEDALTSAQVVQVPIRQDVAIGQSLVARIDDGRAFAGRISSIEHIIGPPQSVTRLEIEVKQ